VCTVDGKDLESLIIDISDPARDVGSFTIPGIDHGILVCGEARLASWKLF
jgi:hypothetical protein